MDQWEIESPHLFGPDVGTSAALFAAGHSPGRVRSVIVGSGAATFPLQISRALKDLVEAPDLAPIAALDPRDVVAGSLDLLEKYELSPEAREDYLSSYERLAQRRVWRARAGAGNAPAGARRGAHAGTRARPAPAPGPPRPPATPPP